MTGPGVSDGTGQYVTDRLLWLIPLLNGAEPLQDSSFTASSEVGSAMAARYGSITGTADDGEMRRHGGSVLRLLRAIPTRA